MNVIQPQPKPCGSCPYRRDVPPGVWHPAEYGKLRAYDRDTGFQPPAVFMCHTSRETLCAGWLACHGPGNLLSVRIGILAGRISPSVIEFSTSVPLFPSAALAAEHGLRGVEQPGAAALKTIAKIERARGVVVLDEAHHVTKESTKRLSELLLRARVGSTPALVGVRGERTQSRHAVQLRNARSSKRRK